MKKELLKDLTDLCNKEILVKIGKTGRATEYKLAEINPKNQKETRKIVMHRI